MIGAGAVRGVRIHHSVEIEAPAGEIYAQWTRFDWSDAIAARDLDWSAAVFEALADRRIAWRGGGDCVCGVAEFMALDAERTVVALELERQPASLLARLGCACGLAASSVARELTRFKRAIEAVQFRRAHIDAQRRELERFRSLIGGVQDAAREPGRAEIRSAPAPQPEPAHAILGAGESSGRT